MLPTILTLSSKTYSPSQSTLNTLPPRSLLWMLMLLTIFSSECIQVVVPIIIHSIAILSLYHVSGTLLGAHSSSDSPMSPLCDVPGIIVHIWKLS